MVWCSEKRGERTEKSLSRLRKNARSSGRHFELDMIKLIEGLLAATLYKFHMIFNESRGDPELKV